MGNKKIIEFMQNPFSYLLDQMDTLLEFMKEFDKRLTKLEIFLKESSKSSTGVEKEST